MSTYSFKDGQGTVNLPNIGTALLIGGVALGIGRIGFNMADNLSENDISADGAAMTSAIAAPNGTVVIEVQQTSTIHKALLAWSNSLVAAFQLGNVALWTAASVFWFNAIDGTSHTALGVSPQKNADKSYEKRGQNVVWTLLAQQLISE
jgi:hypothetical protein